MAKLTLQEKKEIYEKQKRYERGYKDFWVLLLIVVAAWILEFPAVLGLMLSESREHFHSYGVFMIVVSLVGHLTTVLLLALDKRTASIIVSVVSGVLIILFCSLIYIGYERALNTSEMMIQQILVSYVIPAVIVPVADIIMVKRRI